MKYIYVHKIGDVEVFVSGRVFAAFQLVSATQLQILRID